MVIQRVNSDIDLRGFRFIARLDLITSPIIYVVYENNMIIGIALVKETPRKTEIMKIEILREYRGQGYAENLIQYIVRHSSHVEVYCINKRSLEVFINIALCSHTLFTIIAYSQDIRYFSVYSDNVRYIQKMKQRRTK